MSKKQTKRSKKSYLNKTVVVNFGLRIPVNGKVAVNYAEIRQAVAAIHEQLEELHNAERQLRDSFSLKQKAEVYLDELKEEEKKQKARGYHQDDLLPF